MMMRTGLGVRMNGHRTGSDFLGTDASEVDRCGAGHSRRLRGIAVERIGGDHAHAVLSPLHGFVGVGHILRPRLQS